MPSSTLLFLTSLPGDRNSSNSRSSFLRRLQLAFPGPDPHIKSMSVRSLMLRTFPRWVHLGPYWPVRRQHRAVSWVVLGWLESSLWVTSSGGGNKSYCQVYFSPSLLCRTVPSTWSLQSIFCVATNKKQNKCWHGCLVTSFDVT